MRFGAGELLIVALVIFVLFGLTRLRGQKEEPLAPSPRRDQVIRINKPKTAKHLNFQLFGLLILIAGAVMIGIGLGFIQADLLTLGGIAVIVLGVVIVIVARRR